MRYRTLYIGDQGGADRIKNLLDQGGPYQFMRVTGGRELLPGLTEFQPAVILCGPHLPQGDHKSILEFCLVHAPDIPFIMVGNGNGETPMEMIRMGVDDYLPGPDLDRLEEVVNMAVLRKENEKERRKKENRIPVTVKMLCSVLDHSPLGFIIMDTGGGILQLNRAAGHLSERVFGSLLEKNDQLPGCLPAPWKEKFARAVENAARGEEDHFELSFTGKGDKPSWMNFNFIPLRYSGGKVEGICLNLEDISERKINDSKLSQLSRAVEQSPASVVITDMEGNIEYVNKKFEEITGYSAPEVMGKNPRLLNSGHTSQSEYKSMWQTVLSGKDWRGEFHNKKKNGELFWESALISPILDGQGRFSNILAIKEDITLRKADEEEKRRLSSIMEATSDFVGIADTNRKILFLNKAGRELMGYGEQEDLSSFVLDDIIPDSTNKIITMESFPHVLQQGRWKGEFELRDKNGGCFPASVVITLLPSPHGEAPNICLIARDISDMKRAEENLRLSEEKYRDIVENITDLICTHDLDGKILSLNRGAEKMLGFTFDPEGNFNIKDVLTPGTREKFPEYIENIIQNRYMKSLMKVRLKHGGTRTWEFSNSLKHNGVSTPIVRGFARDITEQVKAEEELLQSRAKFQNLVENISGTYWVTDLDLNKTLYVSPSFEKISGRTCDELLSDQSTFISMVHPDDRKLLCEKYEGLGNSDQLSLVYRIRKPGGEIRWISAKSTILAGNNNHRMEYGYAEDITEGKMTGDALRTSEETFRRLFTESADPVLLLDESGFIDCNEAAVSILGYASKDEFINVTPWSISPVQQPDGQVSTVKARRMIDKAREQGSHRFEWVHSRANGTEFMVEVMLTSILLKGKQIFYTVWRDITDRKRSESEILEKNRQLRFLSEHLQNIREEERKYIAREIHDELGQQLTILMMDAAWLNKKISQDEPALREKTRELMDMISETIKTVRRISTELRPSGLDDLGLESAMELHLQEFERRSGIKTFFMADKKKLKIPDHLLTALFRIFQESLTNIARHSKARNVNIKLSVKDGNIHLSINDDGVGYDEAKDGNKKTLGLLGMKERAAAIDGVYIITGKPGRGTTISLVVPLPGSNFITNAFI